MVSNPEQPLFDETLIYKNPSLHSLLCDPIILKAPTPYSIFGLVQVLVGQAGIACFFDRLDPPCSIFLAYTMIRARHWKEVGILQATGTTQDPRSLNRTHQLLKKRSLSPTSCSNVYIRQDFEGCLHRHTRHRYSLQTGGRTRCCCCCCCLERRLCRRLPG